MTCAVELKQYNEIISSVAARDNLLVAGVKYRIIRNIPLLSLVRSSDHTIWIVR